MIDPKMLELSVYNGIPHLLTPVVTDPHKAVAALNWVVREMEERYKRMAALGVRNIDVFNNRVRHAKSRGDRSEEHTSELQSRENLVCRLLLEKTKNREENAKIS